MSGEKCVLAYSGGLDTSALIPYMKEKYGYDIIHDLQMGLSHLMQERGIGIPKYTRADYGRLPGIAAEILQSGKTTAPEVRARKADAGISADCDWDSLHNSSRGIAVLVFLRLGVELDELGEVAAVCQHLINGRDVCLQAVRGELESSLLG